MQSAMYKDAIRDCWNLFNAPNQHHEMPAFCFWAIWSIAARNLSRR
jgi:hypothetical protein